MWCPCEEVVDTGKYFGGWALCDLCNTWQHDECVYDFFQRRPYLADECIAPVAVAHKRVNGGSQLVATLRKRGRVGRVVTMYRRPDNSLFDHLCPWCHRYQPEMDMTMAMLRMIKKLEVRGI